MITLFYVNKLQTIALNVYNSRLRVWLQPRSFIMTRQMAAP